MRRAVAEVARPLPRVRRLELARRGARRRAERSPRRPTREALQPGRGARAAALRRHRHRRRRAADDRHRRVRSRAGRRRRARIAGAHRRRAGHRQVDAAAAGGRALRADGSGRCCTARAKSPSTRSNRAASGSAIERAPLYILAETCLERILEEIARLRPALRHRRLDPDGVLAEVPVGAGQHRPGARGGHAAAVCGQGAEHPDVSRRPRHEGRQPRRTEGARAHRRHGALFRGREAPLASRRARGEEPVRRGQRARACSR